MAVYRGCRPTLVLGGAGSGKTVCGLEFVLAGVTNGEPAVVLSSFESPPELIQVARGLGGDLRDRMERGRLEVLWRPDGDHFLVDEIAADLIAAVERIKARRVFIDGLSTFRNFALHEERFTAIVSSLRRELRSRGVTSFWTEETHEPQGPDIRLHLRSISAIADNIFLLRCVERPERIYRFLNVRKARSIEFDSATYQFFIDNHGVRLDSTSASAAGLLGNVSIRSNIPEAQTTSHSSNHDDEGHRRK